MGIPALAEMFYYGKDFSSRKKKVGAKGELKNQKYHALSVTIPHAIGEIVEYPEKDENTGQKTAGDLELDNLLGVQDENPMTDEELQKIVSGE
jgi:hypothetical protein